MRSLTMNPQPNQTTISTLFKFYSGKRVYFLVFVCRMFVGLHADSEGFLALIASRFSFFGLWMSYLKIDK